MRQRKHSGHANHERWLVSYADFITLMFAFFVMMYANSKTDLAKAQGISDAFRHAMTEDKLAQALAKLMGATPRAARVKEPTQPPLPVAADRAGNDSIQLLPSLRQLNDTLKKEIESGKLEIRMERRGLVISLREASFFPPGGDTVEPATLPTLGIIASEIRRYGNPIRLEGHTDSVPIHTPRFRSNWELSAARGIAILGLFADRFAIERRRMAIAGFADTSPVASNDTQEGRDRNRRVDIVILNEEAQAREQRQDPLPKK